MSEHFPSPGTPQPPKPARSGLVAKLTTPKFVTGAVITLVAVWFMIANSATIRIHLWVVWVSASLWVVLLITFLAGALVGFLGARRRKKEKSKG